MGTKKAVKGRQIPQRTCVGCRQTLEKRNLIRIVRTVDGVKVDRTGKLNGRGAYLHDRRSCWEKALKGSLASALKTEIQAADLEALLQVAQTLPSADLCPAEGSSQGLM